MTSFWGYVTEGVLLLILAQWWLINTCVDIITTQHGKQTFRPKLTYPWPGSNIPVEILYKLIITTFGVLAQSVYGGGRFLDDDGNFQSMTQLMYMSIYGIFWLHALLDLLLWLRVPLVHDSHYASAATGFFWYAVALHFSAQDHQEEGVEVMVRTFPVFILLPLSAAFVVEPLWRSGFTSHVVRAYFLQVYATWCFQCAHALHSADAFPGSAPNPEWDPTDHRNVAYTAAFFGLHLCINLVLTAAAYTSTAVFMRMRHGVKVDNSEDIPSGSGYAALATSDEGTEFDKAASKFLTACS